MKIYYFISLAFLWLITGASTTPLPAHKVIPAAIQNDSSTAGCYLAPPTGFAFTLITPTSISFKWNHVLGAAYFRIRVYDAVNHALVSNYLVLAKTTENNSTATNLVPGVSYDFTVRCVCANGQESL